MANANPKRIELKARLNCPTELSDGQPWEAYQKSFGVARGRDRERSVLLRRLVFHQRVRRDIHPKLQHDSQPAHPLIEINGLHDEGSDPELIGCVNIIRIG